MEKTTENPSRYRHLEKMSVSELLTCINNEDKTVPLAVERALPSIERLVLALVEKLREGGRLFYIGAGTSGRLGVVDASECPPTYGVSPDMVIGLIAGGDHAIRHSVEHAEDDPQKGWADLAAFHVETQDFVIGIAASGTTPYVVGALEHCRKNGIATGCITCNLGSPLAKAADFPVEVVVGPEVVTGSTRMKAGTAQKLVLNMVSTSLMVQLGRVVDNRMVDMKLANKKLLDRGTKMVVEDTGLDYDAAHALLVKYGSVREAVNQFIQEKSARP